MESGWDGEWVRKVACYAEICLYNSCELILFAGSVGGIEPEPDTKIGDLLLPEVGVLLNAGTGLYRMASRVERIWLTATRSLTELLISLESLFLKKTNGIN